MLFFPCGSLINGVDRSVWLVMIMGNSIWWSPQHVMYSIWPDGSCISAQYILFVQGTEFPFIGISTHDRTIHLSYIHFYWQFTYLTGCLETLFLPIPSTVTMMQFRSRFILHETTSILCSFCCNFLLDRKSPWKVCAGNNPLVHCSRFRLACHCTPCLFPHV